MITAKQAKQAYLEDRSIVGTLQEIMERIKEDMYTCAYVRVIHYLNNEQEVTLSKFLGELGYKVSFERSIGYKYIEVH